MLFTILFASAITVIIFICILQTFVFSNSNNSNTSLELPPSLVKLPIIGNIHYLIKYRLPPHEMFQEIGTILGTVYTFWFGDKPVVVVNDYDSAKYILFEKQFAGRPQRYSSDVYSRGFKGIITTDYSKTFKKRSAIAHKCILNSRQFHEEIMISEGEFLIETIKRKISQSGNGSIDITQDLGLTAINCIWMMLFHERLQINSRTHYQVQRMIRLLREGVAVANLLDGFPILRNLPFSNYLFIDECVKLRDELLAEQTTSDSYKGIFPELLKQDNSLTKDTLDMILSDVLIAGIEATSISIQSIIFYLILHNDIKEKCLKEIEENGKNNNEISLNTIYNLHYIRAVVNETLRLSPPTAFTIPHKASENTSTGKYKIPKDTTVLINIHAIHYSADTHKNPEEFFPERFLTEDGKYKTISGYIPFGLGRRQCLGKELALRELMYFTVLLLRNFDFSASSSFDYNTAKSHYKSLSGKGPGSFELKMSFKCNEIKNENESEYFELEQTESK